MTLLGAYFNLSFVNSRMRASRLKMHHLKNFLYVTSTIFRKDSKVISELLWNDFMILFVSAFRCPLG